MEILKGVWKQHLRPRAVVGYGVKIFLPSPPNYVTRSPGKRLLSFLPGALLEENWYRQWVQSIIDRNVETLLTLKMTSTTDLTVLTVNNKYRQLF